MNRCKCGSYAINDDPSRVQCDRCWRDATISELRAKLMAAESRGDKYLEVLVHIEDVALMVVRNVETREVCVET
jgi:ubiquinone/menaquinone biosynthesis C-methylase UbiE